MVPESANISTIMVVDNLYNVLFVLAIALNKLSTGSWIEYRARGGRSGSKGLNHKPASEDLLNSNHLLFL